MSTSRIRRLRDHIALQQEIARRLNRPIDIEQAALDLEGMGENMLAQNQNSLIPVDERQINELLGSITGPSITDAAVKLAQRQNLQNRMSAAEENGSLVTGPMIASMMQLDR